MSLQYYPLYISCYRYATVQAKVHQSFKYTFGFCNTSMQITLSIHSPLYYVSSTLLRRSDSLIPVGNTHTLEKLDSVKK